LEIDARKILEKIILERKRTRKDSTEVERIIVEGMCGN